MSKNLVLGFAALIILAPQALWAACGEIDIAKGDIKVEKSGGGKATPAAKGTKVCQGDTIIAGVQSRAKVKMEDGNELNISPDSKILLETYEYKAADNKKKVMLNVMYGKVRAATREENMYNDKAKDGQANTFQVKTKSAVAGVRGTDFFTSYSTKTTKTEVITVKGTVEVGSIGANGALANFVKVPAGQRTEALPGLPPTPPTAVPSGDMDRLIKESGPSPQQGGAKSPGENAAGPKDGGKDPKGNSGASGGATNERGPNDRTPSSTTPGGGSMVGRDDLGKDPTRQPANFAGPTIPTAPQIPPTAVLPPLPPQNDLTNRTIEAGPAKVLITIAVPK